MAQKSMRDPRGRKEAEGRPIRIRVKPRHVEALRTIYPEAIPLHTAIQAVVDQWVANHSPEKRTAKASG